MSSQNQKIEILTIYKQIKNNRSRSFVIAKCFCGKIFQTRADGIKSGHCRSCGCLNIIQIMKDLKTHGKSYTSTYRTWANMITRCYNKNTPYYHKYGGRGIKVCHKWRNSFESFLQDMGERPEGRYSIDRIDENGHYEPKNCRWLSLSENSRRGTINRNKIYGNPGAKHEKEETRQKV